MLEEQFIEALSQHKGILFKVCNLYCKDTEGKKDLFGEIVLQLWKAFPSFQHQSRVSTWMYRIALNTAISNYRRDSKSPPKKYLSKFEFTIPDLQEHASLNENIQNLYEAINHLSKIEKAIILLYLDEKSYEEIAEIIGITKSNVGTKLSRIKIKLEKILKSYDYELR